VYELGKIIPDDALQLKNAKTTVVKLAIASKKHRREVQI
jgi:hypothetical protein